MDEGGFQPSHYSAMSGNLDVMKYLLTKGAVDLIHIYRTTPLSIACLYGHINIVKFFYENPDLNNHIFSVKEVNYKDKIRKCTQIAEILLRDYNANPNDQKVLDFLAYHLLLDAL